MPSATPLATELIYVPVGDAGSGDGVDVFSYTVATQALKQVGMIAGSATNLTGNDPLGLAVDESGNIYVSATTPNNSTGVIYEYAAGSGSSGTANVAPIRTITTVGEVANLWAGHGMVYANTTEITTGGQTQVYGPSSNTDPLLLNVISDSAGNIFVANTGTNGAPYPPPGQGIYEYTSSGTLVTEITNEVKGTVGLAFDPSGDLFASNLVSQYAPSFACCQLNEYPAGTFSSNPTPTQPLANGMPESGAAIAIDTHGDLIVGNNDVEVYAAGYAPTSTPGATEPAGGEENTFNIAVYPHP